MFLQLRAMLVIQGCPRLRAFSQPFKENELWFILDPFGSTTLCPLGRGLLLQPEWHHGPRWVLCTLL